MHLRLFPLALLLGLLAAVTGCHPQSDAPLPLHSPAAPAQPEPPIPPPAPPSVGDMPTVTLHISNATLSTKVAATPAQEERGLMFVTKMPDNAGMIFLLPFGRAEFWMKNTLIPLSVAFIDKNGVILELHDMQPGDPNLPDNQLPVTRSDSDQVAYALETNLHWFTLNGIKPGDKITPPPTTLGTAPAGL